MIRDILAKTQTSCSYILLMLITKGCITITLMDHKTIEEYILSMPNTRLDYPFGEDVAVYKTGPADGGKMFALIREGKDPVQLSLKCDPDLAKLLRDKYDEEEVQGLIRHSYELVAGN